MEEFFKKNITIFISSGALLIAALAYLLNRNKFRIDKKEIDNKRPNFTIYLESAYRFKISATADTVLLFNLRITNFSTTKNTVIPKLKISYFNEGVKHEINLDHDPLLFHRVCYENLTKFLREIKLDEREIKSGWVIFNFPSFLLNNIIDFYKVSVEDADRRQSNVVCNLIKEIRYEDNPW